MPCCLIADDWSGRCLHCLVVLRGLYRTKIQIESEKQKKWSAKFPQSHLVSEWFLKPDKICWSEIQRREFVGLLIFRYICHQDCATSWKETVQIKDKCTICFVKHWYPYQYNDWRELGLYSYLKSHTSKTPDLQRWLLTFCQLLTQEKSHSLCLPLVKTTQILIKYFVQTTVMKSWRSDFLRICLCLFEDYLLVTT